MCGRYAVRQDPAALAQEFAAADRTGGATGADFNITPTKTVPIVVQRGAERSVRPVRWGLVPTWAEEADGGPPMINARAETITTKPAFSESARRRRCLMPATGWYEWKPGDARRQPHLCRRRDGRSLAMAAVFSAWWDPKSIRQPLVTCAVVTTAAAGELAEVHHRMPLVLPEDRWADWLDPRRSEIDELLRPEPSVLGELALHTVSTEVNSMRNNRPDLLEPADPVPAPAEQAVLFES
ncbi:SOS response-associated peptidase [Saccharopolyspora rhizosphaerae]|uniref:Abasic site processing protein n=1 Tax=Saccharopolyspora rhizosphaerae TaxID=2492662 RepID=A0A3R8NX59_9PSEU|nr:SOS response-associated peptidase [Saccharopolyspora rhizosphaerae]RRO15182.1 SOS response-associated peptidase [Saccharopolyspora rhizosphaerae]